MEEQKQEEVVRMKLDRGQFDPERNSGLLITEPKPLDFVVGNVDVGRVSGIQYREVNPSGDWGPYLPTDERQSGKFFDSMACVSFSALNVIETQINYFLANNMLSFSTKTQLSLMGFIDPNGKFNGSDRFLAKASGTTSAGNYLNVVAETIRKQGIAPERDWTWDLDTFTWELFYAGIPTSVSEKAKQFLNLFDIQYEWVYDMDDAKHLKQAPLQIAIVTCGGWNNPPVAWCNVQGANHAVMMYKQAAGGERVIYDHYVPYIKQLNLDYGIPYRMKIIVSPKENEDMVSLIVDKTKTVFLEFGSGTQGFSIGIQSQKFFELVKSAGMPVVEREPATPTKYTLADNGFIVHEVDPKPKGLGATGTLEEVNHTAVH